MTNLIYESKKDSANFFDTPSNFERAGFTSKPLDKETGLYNFPQRYYDSRNVKWLTLDPIGPMLMTKKPGSVTSLNWYNYCGNNPVMYTDPTGLEEVTKKNVQIVKDEKKDLHRQNFVNEARKKKGKSNQVISDQKRATQNEGRVNSRNDIEFNSGNLITDSGPKLQDKEYQTALSKKIGFGWLTQNGITFSSLCNALSIMVAHDLNVGIDIGFEMKAEFLISELKSDSNPDGLITATGNVEDSALVFTKAYAKFTGTPAPIGLADEKGGARFGVGISKNRVHKVVYDHKYKRVFHNPWIISNWSHDYEYIPKSNGRLKY